MSNPVIMNLKDFQLPKPNMLHQASERDCGLVVFAALSGISEEEICRDLPEARLGKVSVYEWIQWLQQKNLNPLRRDGCPDDIVPCAHLVADNPRDYADAHWVYRDSDGDVHDPSPMFRYMPSNDQRMTSLSFYDQKVLTISVSPPSVEVSL